MLATTVGYQQMIAGHNVTGPIARLNLTLPSGVTDVSATLVKAQVTKSTVTDMPDGTTYNIGYPSMALTFTLADSAALFAPYNSASSLYRHTALKFPVFLEVGGNVPGSNGVTEWLPGFTGTVDSYVCNPDGSVDFTCIDNRNLLRAAVELPAVVTAPPFNAGLTSEFALDHLLRAATNGAVSSWPAKRAQCLVAAGFRSSIWPEVGTLQGSYQPSAFTFLPGAYGTGLSAAGSTPFAVELNFTAPTPLMAGAMNFHHEALVTVGAGGAFEFDINNAGISDFFAVVYLGGSFQVGIGASTSTVSVTLTAGQPHYVSADITMVINVGHVTSWTCALRVDGTVYNLSSSVSHALPDTTPWSFVALTLVGAATVAGYQLTAEATPPTNAGFVPRAVLDPSLNTLQVIPAITGDTWQTIQQIADAEAGVAGFDEAGVFRFKNRNSIRTSASVRTASSKVSLKSMSIELTAAAAVDQVTVPYTGWTFGAFGLAYTFKSAQKVPKKATRSWTVATETLVALVDSTGSRLPNGHSTADGNTWFRASQDPNGLTEAIYTAITVSASQADSSHATVTVTNGSGSDIWLVSPAAYTDIPVGTPSLWVAGQPVTQGDEVTVSLQIDPTVTPTNPYSVSSNPWIQDGDSAHQLMFDLLDDLSTPRPELTNIDIVPDWSLQMTDRVLLQDDDVTGIKEYAVIRGSTLTIDTEVSMTIDARAIASPGQWILDDNERSILDSTTYV